MDLWPIASSLCCIHFGLLEGIMGGMRTGVSEKTTDMFLEIAVFDPISVSKTGRKINLNSDARYRFERGLDQDCPEWVHNYISDLVIDICGGEVSFLEKTGSGPNWSREIIFETQQVFNLTGVNVNEITIEKILSDDY